MAADERRAGPDRGGPDLTGDWSGYYEQEGGRHRLSMQVVQQGASFVGRMRDHTTMFHGAEEVVEVDEQGRTVVLGELESVASLPEQSVVEGEVEGHAVRFTKRYQGTHRLSFWIQGRAEEHIEVADHRVDYGGEVDDDGTTLRGEWSIPGRDGSEPVRGAFELRRVGK